MSIGVSTSKRVAFFGTPELSATYLNALVDSGFNVVCVVTRPPKRRGRGSFMSPSPVEEAARQSNLRVIYSLDQLDAETYDLGLVVAYGRIIPEAVLNRRPLINVHYSLLPKYRGAAPMQWAILSGDQTSGVTLMRVREEMDAGEIYDQVTIEIDGLYLSDLSDVLTKLGVEMVLRWFSRPDEWVSSGVAQVGEISYAPKLEKEIFQIKWDRSVDEIEKVVRLGRSFTYLNGRRFAILRGRPLEDDIFIPLRPGSVVREAPNPFISCGRGALVPEAVRPEGSKEMSFESFLLGHRDQNLFFG